MKLWGAALLSAALLELPFPIAGPMAPARGGIAFVALAPWFWALLNKSVSAHPRPYRRAFLISYFCGVLWYAGNCYWIRDTMLRYGDMPPAAPVLLLAGFSLVLGLYFGLFGLAVMLVQRATGRPRTALLAAPFLWVALDLAASRITSVPWDQLGYSQVDNHILNRLAPWTGVYGITFVIVALNAMITDGLYRVADRDPARGKQFLRRLRGDLTWRMAGAWLALLLAGGSAVLPAAAPATSATAVLIQPNLDVGGDNDWADSAEWNRHIDEFMRLAGDPCRPYIAGIPEAQAKLERIPCPPSPPRPDLIVWPEAPAPFVENEPRFQSAMGRVAQSDAASLIVGGIGADYSENEQHWLNYNSAMVIAADGHRVGRYDKIHLVPFGEYIPFQQYLTFARKLTGRVSSFSRGADRKVFRLNGHRYGVFICYEAVFADEVRHFAELGAEVLVNVSDDGWYGDTSAPWQHLNMARMRAIENRRWLLRDTNNGVTAVIDPEGRVRESIPRHQVDALVAGYGFRDDVTFYTAHGDVFAWLCAILGSGAAGWSFKTNLRRVIHHQVRS